MVASMFISVGGHTDSCYLQRESINYKVGREGESNRPIVIFRLCYKLVVRVFCGLYRKGTSLPPAQAKSDATDEQALKLL